MPLTVGTKAPDFTLSTKTADGPKQIKLSDNFGKKNTLLLFFSVTITAISRAITLLSSLAPAILSPI